MEQASERTQERITFEQFLFSIVSQVVDHSEGTARMAFNEEDTSTEVTDEASHFLKIGEHRIGRDIELYGFMGELQGKAATLVDFLGEVVLSADATIPGTFSTVSGLLCQEGLQFIPLEHQAGWVELVGSLEKPTV